MERKNKVAGYRVMLGKTQKDVADILHITAQAYGAKENGKRAFKDSEKTIIKELIAEQFPDITYEELFFGQNVQKKPLDRGG